MGSNYTFNGKTKAGAVGTGAKSTTGASGKNAKGKVVINKGTSSKKADKPTDAPKGKHRK